MTRNCQLGIAGFEGLDTVDYSPLQLTTVIVPLHEIGAAAMRVIAAYINQPNRPCETVTLPVHLHVGESTAAL